MKRTGGNLRGYMRRTLADAYGHPPALAAARFLAADPWFCRAVCPAAEGMRVVEAFVVPIVVQAALTAGLRLHPDTPVNDTELEKLTGVPRIGEAFLAAKVVARDAFGFYELSRVLDVVPHVRYDKRADDKAYHERLRRAAKALGYKYDAKAPGRIKAFKHWAESKGHNTSGLLARLLKPEGISGTSEKPAEGKRRPRRQEATAIGEGVGTAAPAGDRPEEDPESPHGGAEVLRRDPPPAG